MKPTVTRRTFIRGTGAALAGLAITPRVGLSAADLTRKPDKLALLGGTPVRSQPYSSTWPIIDKAEEDALLTALKSRNWCCLRGHCVYDFEKTFAAAMGAGRAVLSNGGTTALGASLACLGVGAGDEVITTPNTFIATINVITNLHALPVYVDIDPDTGSIDAELIEEAITENTRAILPVHLAGFPVDIEKIMSIANQHRIPVVEDACQSVFAEVGGKKVGTFGATGCISFQEWKSLVSGEGGAILCSDDELGRRCASFVNNGRDAKGEIGGYPFPGSNHRMTEFQAAILTAQYEKFLRHDAARQKHGRYLEETLGKITGFSPRKRYNPNTRFTYVQFEMDYDPEAFKDVPAATFAKALRAEGIPFNGGPRIYRGGCHKEGMLEEHLNSRGFVKAFGKARLKAYRESLKKLQVMDGLVPAKKQFLSMDSKIPLLGSDRETEDIVTAFAKVVANLDALRSA
ncbi:MAG: DegT/DnrJ/EryC1/StrS family aminotransferase [Phycisphaerae bacterium]|nr:DegT/DnrJ/EryC1/StrS family aminotransferase [Phycisphaerae bacterium]